MLDKDKCHADVGWQRVHEPAAGIKTTRRGAYSDNREVRNAANLAVCLRGAPAGSRPDHFGLARTGAWHSAVLKGRRPTAIQPIERYEDRA